MLRIDARTIASVTDGELLAGAPDAVVSDVVIDSRHTTPGCAFLALEGERSDGHEFCAVALERGARALIVSREGQSLDALITLARERDAVVVRVSDGVSALQDLAAYHRSRLKCEVVGITGSTGKTTTKDFVRAALESSLRVVCTEGNRNNELGVPLTILRAGMDTDVLIVEMGMRGEGEIAALCEIARPSLGLITNVGTSHIEILGSQDAVARAKGELVRCLSPGGCAFLNGDDAFTDVITEWSSAPIIRWGLSGSCEVTATDVSVDVEGRPRFTLVAPQGSARIELPVPGRHNVYNALAASAIGLHLGVSPEAISAGLAAAELSAMRMQLFESASGITVINDAYNANPVSMRAAIETLSDMQTSGKRVAVLGDMAELGSLTEVAHFRIGEQVARLPIDVLVTVGPRAERIAQGARAEGMPANQVRACAEAPEAVEVLDDLLASGDVVLVKASRVMGLEVVAEGIVNPR